GQPLGALGPLKDIKVWQGKVKNLAVENEQGTGGNVLGGGSHFFIDREVVRGAEFWYSHLSGVAFLLKQDEVSDIVEYGTSRFCD
ncbi:MAG: hypothetical protein P5681_11105, partial [Limnospira sp. PMC 894.15]